jgi:hypothetical protein
MIIINIISEIVSGTPFYVWVIFIVLLKRGMKSTKDGELSFKLIHCYSAHYPLIFYMHC